MELNDDNILRFWQWFVKNENTIKECIENEDSGQKEYVVEQMNEQILSLGVLTWDVGLNDDEKWFLMLSPNGNREMFEVSQKIMDAAPEHMAWLFYSSKPAKEWNRQFTIYDDYMDEQFIDATPWNYIVFEEDDGKLELIIEAKNILQLDSDSANAAAEQFVIQEIGEATRILLISSVVIMHTLESEYESSKAPVLELKEHLEEIG
ncbi:MAG: hypothetical protein HRT58_05485 [Crocinitomicaceae bacterium]|nr:hypothetical protein [Flavobacteriales bacterium]NQZ35092.1 hypothetical protein [Crocinitomicaceae bacterium]